MLKALKMKLKCLKKLHAGYSGQGRIDETTVSCFIRIILTCSYFFFCRVWWRSNTHRGVTQTSLAVVEEAAVEGVAAVVVEAEAAEERPKTKCPNSPPILYDQC